VCNNEADSNQYEPRLYRGPDAVRHFWDRLEEDVKAIEQIYRNEIPMSADGVRELVRSNAEVSCHICGRQPLDGSTADMVIDHCHLTGRVRGWACNECNLNYSLPHFVPV